MYFTSFRSESETKPQSKDQGSSGRRPPRRPGSMTVRYENVPPRKFWQKYQNCNCYLTFDGSF